jgi:glycosyltransferase involved in cell wall biosynthesis
VVKVSVIIPNYNHAIYLPQRIESVLNQTYQDIEVLLLDDCSSDGSHDVIATYAARDERIRVVLNEQNSGSVFKQWHKGLSLANGSYIWIAESDDFAEPDFLTELVQILEDNGNVAFAYCDSWVVDDSNKIVSTTSEWKNKYFNTSRWNHNYIVDGVNELENFLSEQCTINNASSVLFRRKCVTDIGGIDTSFRYAGDWLTYIKLSINSKIAYSGKKLSNYRSHSSNASLNSLWNGAQLFERQKCFAYIYDTKVLNKSFEQKMLSQASREYMDMLYQIFKQRNGFKILMPMLRSLFNINVRYILDVISRSVKIKVNKLLTHSIVI